ncbi:MAG: M23 family metallopeptidase [Spirochaetales bacterium]|nr:MAG: M23 family metallopeptidase [Spirochaetales bacterium]
MTSRIVIRSAVIPAWIALLSLLALSLGGTVAGIVSEPPGTPRIMAMVKDFALQGDPLFVSLAEDPTGISPETRHLAVYLRFADGTEGPPAPIFPMPNRSPESNRPSGREIQGLGPSAWEVPRTSGSAWLALVGVPTSAATGPALVRVVLGNLLVAETTVDIRSRTFRKEDIRLDDSLTSLRTDSDPVKTAQAERYLAIIARTEPAAVYLDQGFVRPVAGERRTSLFGDRRRYLYSTGGMAPSEHAGIDYGYPRGTPVVAAGRGRVAMAEERIVTGLTVIIEHLPGVYTIYMHLSRIDVTSGDIVECGQLIGAVGATGLATGPHLHWELRIGGVACDPEALIGIDKVPDIRTMGPAIEGR